MCSSNGENYNAAHSSTRACSVYKNAAADNTKVLVKTAETNLYGYLVENTNGSKVYVQLFNAAATADVNLGTTVCDDFIFVPATGAADAFPSVPMNKFPLGLVIAVTTTIGGNTNPGAACPLKILYK